MIDEKKLIEDIEKEFDGVCVYDVSPSQAVNDFVEIVDRQPKVGQWIPCSERLPEVDGEYLVTTKYSQIPTILEWRMGYWFDEEANIYKVIAWMPFPPAFKESEDLK